MAGRPTKCTPELIEQAKAYVLEYKDVHEHVIPSVVGLCKVLKIAKSSVYLWGAEEDSEFSDILEELMEYQQHELLNSGLSGTFNSTITKLILTKHGYTDKQDTQLTGAQGGPLEITYEGVKSDGKR